MDERKKIDESLSGDKRVEVEDIANKVDIEEGNKKTQESKNTDSSIGLEKGQPVPKEGKNNQEIEAKTEKLVETVEKPIKEKQVVKKATPTAKTNTKTELSPESLKKVNEIIEKSFEKLRNKNNILAYKQKTKSFEKLSAFCTAPDTVIVDLSINKKMEKKFLDKFSVSKLPCLISYGLKIYDNENLQDNLIERGKRELNFYKQKVVDLVTKNQMFIFIKGSPAQPKCRFTRALLEILNNLNLQNGLDYSYFNILSDEVLREKLKIITEWPTYPQIFIRGKFIGGTNSLVALKEENLLNEIFKGG